MRLISLKIRNFRVLKAVDLTFDDLVIAIVGVNGAGKSSIIEAISWALYGNQAARSGKEEIKSTFARPDEDTEVSLDFLINEEKFRVTRRLIGKTERPEVQLFRGEASESVGVNETRRYVGELLGLDWKGFLTSFLARQQELNALSSLQPARRKDHLAGMLGIERLDKAITRTKEDIRVAAGQAAVLEKQVGEADSIAAAITERTARKSELETQVAEVADRTRKAGEAAVAAESVYGKAQERRAAWQQLTTQKEAAARTRHSVVEQLADLTTERQSLEQAAAQVAELEKSLARLAPARQELDTARAAQSRKQWHDQLVRRVEELTKEAAELRRQVGATTSAVAQITEKMSKLPETVEAEAEKTRVELDKAREDFHSRKAARDSLSTQIAKLLGQMQSIEQLGPESVCDRCHRPFGDDLPEIRGHLAAELDTLTGQLNRLDDDLTLAKAEGLRLKEQSTALDEQVQARRELSIKLEAARREAQTVADRQKDVEERLAQSRSELAEAGDVTFDPSLLDSLTAEVARLEEIQKTVGRLQGQLARRPVVEKGLEQAAERRDRIEAEIADIEGKLTELNYSADQFESSRSTWEQARSEHESARQAQVAVTREFELVSQDLANKQENLARIERARVELEGFRTGQYYGEKLAGLFTEFRGFLISRIRPTLADFSSRLMSDMTDGRYTMVELDEKYNLRVFDSGQFYGVERYSGGEKDLANLCLRLAISEALTESAGLIRSFIILDEVFGSQDDERKELIVRGLSNLKHRFPQILLITHISDIKDRVERVIEVTPTGYGWSTVSVNGTPA